MLILLQLDGLNNRSVICRVILFKSDDCIQSFKMPIVKNQLFHAIRGGGIRIESKVAERDSNSRGMLLPAPLARVWFRPLNVVSPTLLEDSVETYGDFFPGFIPINGKKVGQAFKRSIFGVQTGQIYRVF